MRFLDYLKDKIFEIMIFILLEIVVFIFLNVTYAHSVLKIYIPVFILLATMVVTAYDYYRRREFYNVVQKSIEELNKKYLVSEVVKKPNFIDGQLLFEYLYETDKSMNENVNKYKYSQEEFKEYIEMWCHEIKTPISTSKMIIENNKNEITKDINEEIDKIESYIEQVMFYARSEEVEKDYIIKQTNLEQVINNVVMRNKKDFFNKNIKIDIENVDINVNSDSKWIEFIINQIITNSIKYSKDDNAQIKIYTSVNKNSVILYIEDNGIGIESNEIERVFEKGFTGSNGRNKYNSTGIGLYLCDKLCKRLNHNIEIESIKNEKTIVKIIFPKDSIMQII